MKYTFGAIKNTPDIRDVPLTAVQTPVSVPNLYVTDISMIPVLNQGGLGSCVGHAHAVIHTYFEYLETKNLKSFSPRYLYALSKKLDGYPSQGTYPRLTNSIMLKNGCALIDTVPNDITLTHETYIDVKETANVTKQAELYKVKGYVFIPNNIESIKQAIFQNGLIAISIHVGDFNHAPMKKGNIGSHRVVAYGYETIGNDLKILCRNSWGEQWGDKGNFFIMWSDFKDGIDDINTYTDIPNKILEEYKAIKYKYFKESEVIGLKHEFVTMLDKARGFAGVPFVITSGYRTPEKNSKVGGVENSTHTNGLGADIKCTDSAVRFKMIKAFLEAGFTRIGIYTAHIHVDMGKNPQYPENVVWFINKE